MTDIYPPIRLDQGGSDSLPMTRPDGPLPSDIPGIPDIPTPSPPVPVPA